jgi:hypothetical protein
MWASTNTAEIVSQFTRRDLVVDRREVARRVAGVVFGSALFEPLERWLNSAEEPVVTGPPGVIGFREVSQIEHAARLFRDWDDQFGGGLRRKAVVGQLNEVADVLRDSHPQEIRHRLFSAMAQLAETTAIMSWDSGQQVLAQRYYLLALRAAKSGGDTSFAANVLAGMARQLLYLGRSSDALELIRIAQTTASGTATPTVLALLYTREAWGYASQGRLSAFRRAAERAEDALADANHRDDPYWISYFNTAELSGTIGGRLLELSQRQAALAKEASTYIERAIVARGTGHLRSTALDYLGLAEARLIQGDLDEAARVGHRAIDVVEQTLSDRVRIKLAELHQHMASHHKETPIASLRDRIRSIVAASPTQY